MTFGNDKENIFVKNVVDYGDLSKSDRSSNIGKFFPNPQSPKSDSDSVSSSIDEKIINILTFKDERDSNGSNDDGTSDDSVDDMDYSLFDEELEYICSLGFNPFEEMGINRDSLEDYFNPYLENHPEEIAFLSVFEDFTLVQMSFSDMIKEVYFEE